MDPKSVTPVSRVCEFPNENLTGSEKILLVQSSSAAAEWVFSLLQNLFGIFEDALLADYINYIKVSLMLHAVQ